MKPLCLDEQDRPFHLEPRDITDELVKAIPKKHLKWYVERRATGHPGEMCFSEVFGPHVASGEYLRHLVEVFEALPTFRAALNASRDSLPINQLWNVKTAIAELERLIHNPVISKTVRIRAARERDVILSAGA